MHQRARMPGDIVESFKHFNFMAGGAQPIDDLCRQSVLDLECRGLGPPGAAEKPAGRGSANDGSGLGGE